MSFPIIHGLSLASGSQIENLVVENLAADPDAGSLTVGRMWFNTTDQKLRMAALDGGGAIIVQDVILQNEFQVVRGQVWTLEDDVLYSDGRRAMSGDLDMGGTNAVTNVADPVNDQDAANKRYVDAKVGNLGSVFEFVGNVSGGADEPNAFDLDSLAKKEGGDFYQVAGDGWFKWTDGDGNIQTVQALVKDGFVYDLTGVPSKIDNTNSSVAGSTGEIVVTGDSQQGFSVSIDPAYTAAITAATSGGANTQAELDASQVAAGINDDGTYSPVATANYISSATSIKSATQIIDTQLKTNADAIVTADTNSQTRDDAIELGAGLNTNGTYQPLPSSNYVSAATSIHNATSLLDSQIKVNEDAVVAAIARARQELTDYAGIHEGRERYWESTTPNTVHTISHALGDNFISTVWVYDNDSMTWQKDLVSETQVDSSTFKVELSVARNIRVAMKSIQQWYNTDWHAS